LYDRVALPKGTNQNLSMRSLQIQWDQEIVKVLSDLLVPLSSYTVQYN